MRGTGKPDQRAKGVCFILALLPLFYLVVLALLAGLGANPVERVLHHTGDLGLNLLILTLCVSPAKRLIGKEWIGPVRRTAGLFAFFYASLHLITYVVLDQSFSVRAIAEDTVRHRRIIVGFVVYLLLFLLALTPSASWSKRLGVRKWKNLHRLVYFAAAGDVVHYLWLVKKDLRLPLVYSVILALLLAYRIVERIAGRHGKPKRVV